MATSRSLFLASVLSAATACSGPRAPSSTLTSHPLYGKSVPAFTRPAINAPTATTENAGGHVVVLKFFAKYCVPCAKTLPHAEALHRAHPEVRFVGVAEDENSADVREIIAKYSLTFPVVHDVDNILSGRFRISDLPVTFVVGKNGLVSWVGGPNQGEEDLERAVDLAVR